MLKLTCWVIFLFAPCALAATNLMQAIQTSDTAFIESRIERGVDLNQPLMDEKTALIHAVLLGRYQIVNFLLEKGVKVDKSDPSGRTALMYAITKGDAGITFLILNAKPDLNLQDDVGMTALCHAVLSGRDHLVNYLLSLGADPLIKDQWGNSPANYSDILRRDSIRNLLQAHTQAGSTKGMDHPQIEVWKALKSGDPKTLERVFNLPNVIEFIKNEGFTPLTAAADFGHLPSLKYLLTKVAIPDELVPCVHETALIVAIKRGRYDVIEFLIQNQADVNFISIRGETPLGQSMQDKDVFNLLTSSGANTLSPGLDKPPVFLKPKDLNRKKALKKFENVDKKRRKWLSESTQEHDDLKSKACRGASHPSLMGDPGLTPPKINRSPSPGYPRTAEGTHIQGEVHLECVFKKTGQIENIKVVKGLGDWKLGFELEAIETLKRYRFEPGQLDGRTVDVQAVVILDFLLRL